MKRCVLLAVFFALSGCAPYMAAKDVAPLIVDKAVDKAHALTCNMRYKTEARFLARHTLKKEALAAWCKR